MVKQEQWKRIYIRILIELSLPGTEPLITLPEAILCPTSANAQGSSSRAGEGRGCNEAFSYSSAGADSRHEGECPTLYWPICS